MDAKELAERLRQRRKELEAAKDWVPFTSKGSATQTPIIRMTYSTITLNKAAREHIRWQPKTRVQIDYSPSEKAPRFSLSKNGAGYSWKGGAIPARAIYSSFGIDTTAIRELDYNEYRQEAIPIGDSLIIDVSPFVK